MRYTFTLLSLRCERRCYLWWHWELLKNRNSEKMVGHLIEKPVQPLTKSSQLKQSMCSLMMTFWMKQAPCWILMQVQASTRMMRMMGQEYQWRNPQDRVQLAYQKGKKQMDCNSGIPQDDRIYMQIQTYKIHAGYNECKVVLPDYKTKTYNE